MSGDTDVSQRMHALDLHSARLDALETSTAAVASLFTGIGIAGEEPASWTLRGSALRAIPMANLTTLRFAAQKNVAAGSAIPTTVVRDTVRVRDILQ